MEWHTLKTLTNNFPQLSPNTCSLLDYCYLQSQNTEEMKTEVGEDEEEIKENNEDDLKSPPSPEQGNGMSVKINE